MFTRLFELLFNQPPAAFVRGKLVFASRIPGELRLVLFIVAVAVVWFLYRKAAAKTSRKVYLAVLSLRIALVVLLIFILGGPTLRISTPKKGSLFTAVLVDTSHSMSIADVPTPAGPVSRIRAAGDVLFPAGKGQGLLAEIAQDSQVILYSFSDFVKRARPEDLAEARGSFTNLFRAVRDVDTELRATPLSALVLVTDGCRNTGGSTSDAAQILQARGVPIYVLGVGDPNPPRDLEVVEVAAPRQVRRDSEVEVDVTVRHTGFDKPFDVQLKRGDAVLLTRTVTPSGESDLQRVRLLFTPDHEGTTTYRVEIPVVEGEQIKENNVRDFLLEIKDDRLPVLYIEGSPRMEYRFLRRALFRDKNFRLVGMLRLAANRFYIQGASDSEAYLKEGFPDTPERLAAFQAIICGDIEASVFTPKQMALLEDFVKRRGGGLLMLGGVNSFGLGGYTKTPVGAMLPVAISAADAAYTDEQFVAEPIEENMQHMVMRLSPDPVENKVLWNNAPPLIGITPLSGIKPGATLLLDQPRTHNPVLAVQNYGEGRVAAFTSGGSWYWRVSKPATDEFHERFWKQLIRYLVVGAKEQLTISTDAEIYARSDPVTIRATVLGKDMQPLDDATVVATVTNPTGNAQQIPLDWILSEEGVYQCRLAPDVEGQYQISVAVKGWTTPPVTGAFLVARPNAELANAGMKKDALEEMASLTQGKFFDLSTAGQMAEEIRRNNQTSAAAAADWHDEPIWNMPLLFVLMVSLAAAEWLLRRRNGLA
jgi:uncharacterized membrane protein